MSKKAAACAVVLFGGGVYAAALHDMTGVFVTFVLGAAAGWLFGAGVAQ